MKATHVLVAHHDPAVRHLAAGALNQEGVRISLASSEEEGLELLKKEDIQVLVTGWDAFGVGDDFVRKAATIHPLLGVVLMFDKTSVDGAPQRAHLSPVEYLARPITNDTLRSAVRRALERQTRRAPGAIARDGSAAAGVECRDRQAGIGGIVAASKAMRDVMNVVRRCAPTDAPVVICGEPDTGKELIAAEIHRQSARAGGPLVRVACDTLRDADLAERLFGRRERGADRDAPVPASLLQQAQGGTLFLHNVSQLPLWAQVELLDALQQGATGGDDRDQPAGVRVIASTTADLRTAAAQHLFSSSLYYYLNVVQIYVPPLRHRAQDIRPLANVYLAIANAMRAQQGASGRCRFSEDAWQCLAEYDWPGNTLQLASVVSHAVLLADEEEITRAKLAKSLGDVSPQNDADRISVPLLGDLRKIERAVIEAVIERCRGNKAAAARALGLHRRTLYRILQEENPVEKAAEPMPLVFSPSVGDYTADACI